MRIEAKIQKWGNGLAIRIAGIMRDVPHFQEGTPVAVEVTAAGLIITKIPEPTKTKFPYTEAELLAAMTTQSAHADLIAKPLDNEF